MAFWYVFHDVYPRTLLTSNRSGQSILPGRGTIVFGYQHNSDLVTCLNIRRVLEDDVRSANLLRALSHQNMLEVVSIEVHRQIDTLTMG